MGHALGSGCGTNRYEGRQEEKFLDLQVPIHESASLHDALQLFYALQVLRWRRKNMQQVLEVLDDGRSDGQDVKNRRAHCNQRTMAEKQGDCHVCVIFLRLDLLAGICSTQAFS